MGTKSAFPFLHGLAAVAVALALAGGLLAAPPAFAQAKKQGRTETKAPPAGPKPADIDRNGVLILVRSTLLAVDQANKTGNYTVLRDLGSINFQVNTAARLAEIFASQRRQQLDIAAVAVLDPQLSLLPQIEPDGKLHMAGFFPSVPTQLNFELLYEPVNLEWRLFGLSVNLSPGGPKAPDAPPPKQPAISTEPPKAPTSAITTLPIPRPKE